MQQLLKPPLQELRVGLAGYLGIQTGEGHSALVNALAVWRRMDAEPMAMPMAHMAMVTWQCAPSHMAFFSDMLPIQFF